MEERITNDLNDSFAIAGHSAQFDCEVEHHVVGIVWNLNGKRIYVYSEDCVMNPAGEKKYFVTKSAHHFILHIKEISLEDGGTYTCSTDTDEKSANLLVFGEC